MDRDPQPRRDDASAELARKAAGILDDDGPHAVALDPIQKGGEPRACLDGAGTGYRRIKELFDDSESGPLGDAWLAFPNGWTRSSRKLGSWRKIPAADPGRKLKGRAVQCKSLIVSTCPCRLQLASHNPRDCRRTDAKQACHIGCRLTP